MPPVHFPLRVSPNHRYLVDNAGQPFLLHGDSPWDIIVTPNETQVAQYLDNRRAKGINALLIELIEHKAWPNVAFHAPKNSQGIVPFRTPGDFSQPNDEYFAYAHGVVAAARSHGMAVLLTPAYMGYVDTDEGWWNEMSRMPVEACVKYGKYLAMRFNDLDNIIWVHGGDRTPAPGSSSEACGLAIMHQVLAIPGSLHTAHWNRGVPDDGSLDEPAFAPFVNLDAAYTYHLSYQLCAKEYARTPALPTFLIETQYEGEHATQPFELRRQAYWADLFCGAGQIMGNLPLWSFASGWTNELESVGAHDMVYLVELLQPRRWFDLVPDHQQKFVTAGFGHWGQADYIAAAATDDGRLGIVYVPSTGRKSRTLSIQLSSFSAPVALRWYNPTSGTFTLASESPYPNHGIREFRTPGDNGSRQNDWVMVFETNN